jgi:uncharacterized protein YeeX (DUF496 family)
MATIIVFSVLGVSAAVYGVVSAVKAHRQHKRGEKSDYHKKVEEYTIKRGYPISSNYNDLEKRLENGEQLKPVRNPMDNPIYRDIKELNEKIIKENPNRVPLYRNQQNLNDYQQL